LIKLLGQVNSDRFIVIQVGFKSFYFSHSRLPFYFDSIIPIISNLYRIVAYGMMKVHNKHKT